MRTLNIINRYRRLNTTIEGYGYEYSMKRMLISSLIIVIGCVFAGYYYRLRPLSIMFLALYVLLLYPTIVIAQFRMLANNDSFEQLSNYMDHMIIAFKRSPKILGAMQETYPMTQGKLRRCLGKAINIIENDNSEDVYYNAFAQIEDEFRTSRLRTLHRFLLNVERENSVSYQANIDTLYYDIHNWVTRIYAFQGRLKQAKLNITISIGIALMIIAYFSQTISKVSDAVKSVEITDGNAYQIATLLFLVVIIGLYVLVNSKLNGVWLIEDMKSQIDDRIIEVINQAESYDVSAMNRKSVIRALPILLIAAGGLYLGSRLVVLIAAGLFLFMASNSSRLQKGRIRRVKKALLKEFPSWLRDISVNLHNMVEVNAVATSYESAPSVMKPFIERFIRNIEEDPVSVEPYDSFFGSFRVPELVTSIKTLYSLQSQSAEDSQRQVNALIERNQELIIRSEELRLKDTTSSITFLSAVPMLAMTAKLMCDMVIVLLQVLMAL